MFHKAVITGIRNTVKVKASQGWHNTMYNRLDYGLLFCQSGKITYSHKDKKYISAPDRVLLVPKGATYSMYINESGIFPVINFSAAHELVTEFTVIPISSAESYLRSYSELASCMLFAPKHLKAYSVLYDILYRLSLENKGNMWILNPAVKLISEEFHKRELTNKTLADACRISEVYFRKLFKESFSVSPRQYILNVKITKARDYLRETEMSIESIAFATGFSGVSHFSYMFKLQTGMSPSEYRKAQNLSLL